jgi:hypothetical protein
MVQASVTVTSNDNQEPTVTTTGDVTLKDPNEKSASAARYDAFLVMETERDGRDDLQRTSTVETLKDTFQLTGTQAREIFASMDTSGDGTVDQTEYQAFEANGGLERIGEMSGLSINEFNSVDGTDSFAANGSISIQEAKNYIHNKYGDHFSDADIEANFNRLDGDNNPNTEGAFYDMTLQQFSEFAESYEDRYNRTPA